MLTCIANRPSLINSKTKPNEAIPNIDEHNKTNSVFSICLMPRASSVLFNDGEAWTVQSIIRGYHEYISKLSLESELDLKILQYHYVSVPRSLRKTHWH